MIVFFVFFDVVHVDFMSQLKILTFTIHYNVAKVCD